MKKAQKIDVHGLSIPGVTHEKNHDHFAIATLNKSMRLHQTNLSMDDDSRVHGHNQGHLFVVADGVSDGPMPAGASVAAVDSVVQYFLNEMPWYHLADGDPVDVTLTLEDAVRNAQEDRMLTEMPGGASMSTTMTLAFVFWPDLYVAHVGDSRCYLKRQGALRQLTTDTGEGARGPMLGSPEQNLWSALRSDGSEALTEVRHVRLEEGDLLALVSDGIASERSAEDVRALLDPNLSAEDVCGRLVGSSSLDDRTAIVVRFLPLENDTAGVSRGPGGGPLRAHAPTPEETRGKRVGRDRRRASRFAS